MRDSHRNVPDLGRLLRRSCVFACLASLLLVSRSEAAVTLVFGQTGTCNPISLINDGAGGNVPGSETITGTDVPITITAIAPGATKPAPLDALLTLSVHNTGPATVSGADISEPFSGTFSITTTGGTNILSSVGTFTDLFHGVLSPGSTNGGVGAVLSANPPNNLNFSSNFGLPTGVPLGLTFSFSNITPGLDFTGTSGTTASVGVLGTTTMSISGNFHSTVVPEPSTLLIGSLVGLGFFGYGLRMRKAKGE